MISENRVISHLTRKPWVTQAGELWESTANSSETGAMIIFGNWTLPKIYRPGLEWGLAQQMKQVLFMHWIPLCSLLSSTRDMQTPSENIKKHNPLQRAPFCTPSMCLIYSLLFTQRGLHCLYSGWSWWNNITASENTSIRTGITNKMNALWGVLQ